ncbi:putative reverse transcriptase domain-containing protein, partial [Tanacetum coccineum]
MRTNHGLGVLFRPRIGSRVVVEAVDREEIKASARGPVEVRVDRVTHPVIADDIPEPAQEGAVEMLRVREKMPNTRSGASRTREGVNEQIDRRLAGALGARGTARNLEPLIRDEGKQEEVSGNGGNGNGNGNGGGYGYNFRGFMLAKECTYQDFLKCQPLNFNGTEGVVGTVRIEAAYVMSWAELMKLMKEVYCPRNKIQKIETKLWNLAVKGNDLTAYTRRFQELVLLCTRMVLNEEDKVESFFGGLPDNIQGNVIAAEPTRLQDAIRIANNLMDEKLKGYARSAENKRRLENNPRDNHGQQPIFKRQNVGGQNIARAYTAGNNERKGYDGSLPYCNKCKLHHIGPCTMRCGNCKRVGHMTRDCKVTVTPNTQRVPVGNQQSIICYECGRPGYFRKY